MKVVIDECLPRRLANALADHKVWTVQQIRLNGLLNGALLKAIKDDFDVFITVVPTKTTSFRWRSGQEHQEA